MNNLVNKSVKKKCCKGLTLFTIEQVICEVVCYKEESPTQQKFICKGVSLFLPKIVVSHGAFLGLLALVSLQDTLTIYTQLLQEKFTS